jgi:hypothetical protein
MKKPKTLSTAKYYGIHLSLKSNISDGITVEKHFRLLNAKHQ